MGHGLDAELEHSRCSVQSVSRIQTKLRDLIKVQVSACVDIAGGEIPH